VKGLHFFSHDGSKKTRKGSVEGTPNSFIKGQNGPATAKIAVSVMKTPKGRWVFNPSLV